MLHCFDLKNWQTGEANYSGRTTGANWWRLLWNTNVRTHKHRERHKHEGAINNVIINSIGTKDTYPNAFADQVERNR